MNDADFDRDINARMRASMAKLTGNPDWGNPDAPTNPRVQGLQHDIATCLAIHHAKLYGTSHGSRYFLGMAEGMQRALELLGHGTPEE